MGTDDLFKKRRAARKKRQHEMKTPKANSYLIVTEGKRTEPLYLRGLQKEIIEKVGGAINVVECPTIDVHGAGCSTGSLLQVTERLVREAKILYQNVWVVFDKDDFQDFDTAIAEATDKGYRVAWSNQAFEYWLYLHFYYSDSALHRHEWNKKLDEIFAEYGLGNGEYAKNYEDIYNMVDTYGGVATAIKNAKRRMASFDVKRDKPSEYDPGTMVYELVEELRKYVDTD
ncbi:MAG: RloB domain-containing protein [Lachnospiraceae bacterium]|nr:RloB domain-containing protein [Lachnospiraceae bacterium]